jgi:hypothetical protein
MSFRESKCEVEGIEDQLEVVHRRLLETCSTISSNRSEDEVTKLHHTEEELQALLTQAKQHLLFEEEDIEQEQPMETASEHQWKLVDRIKSAQHEVKRHLFSHHAKLNGLKFAHDVPATEMENKVVTLLGERMHELEAELQSTVERAKLLEHQRLSPSENKSLNN